VFKIFGITIKFEGTFFPQFASGLSDDLKCWNNDQIAVADFNSKMLNECLPPSDHFEENGYNTAIKFLRKRDKVRSVSELTGAVISSAQPVCVYLYKKVFFEVVVGCPKLLSDALPMTWY
jgi:hypothetical protein